MKYPPPVHTKLLNINDLQKRICYVYSAAQVRPELGTTLNNFHPLFNDTG
jgi:hypothetical protein